MSRKTIDTYVEAVFPIECKGKDTKGKEALKKPVEAKVKIYKRPGSSNISSLVECQYNTGIHGQRCKASHPDIDIIGEGIICSYSFDIPYALDEYIRIEREYHENYATLEKENRKLREELKREKSKPVKKFGWQHRTPRPKHYSDKSKEPCY